MIIDEKKQLAEVVTIAFEVLALLNPEIDLSKCDSNMSLDNFLDLVQNIRMNARYRLFDLEATRREFQQVRKMLKDSGND